MCALSKRKRRAVLLSRVASLALLSGLAAGCSADVSRFSEPIFSSSSSSQDTTVARSEPAAVDTIETGSIGRTETPRVARAARSQAPRPAVPVGSSQIAAAPQPLSDTAGSAVVPVTQSSLDPLPPMPAQVASAGQAQSSQWSSHAGAQAGAAEPKRTLPPSVVQAARLPASQAGSAGAAAADPIETGSIPPTGRDAPITAAAPVSNGWSRAGGSLVTVTKGESGHTLARRYGVPVDAILVANNMKDPNAFRAGQKVIIPTYVYSSANKAQSADSGLPQGRDAYKLVANAPVPKGKPGGSVRPTSTASSASGSRSTDLRDGSYVVRPGDSVISISSKFSTSPKALRSVNGLQPDAVLWIGQKLRIPSATAETQVASLNPSAPLLAPAGATRVPAPKPRATASRAPATPSKPVNATSTARTEPAKQPKAEQAPKPDRTVVAARPDPAKASDATQPAASATKPVAGKPAGRFGWPAKGPVISRFGRKANGERNDGINISVPRGTPVHAAENGVVIYAGNELKGYGNLVLVRHGEGWVSAYAHNHDLSVKRGDAVKKGQVIATAGDTGSVSEPQVHFELRRNSKPVDPMPLLAAK